MQENIHLHYRKDIDGLRAIAVLSVIFYHGFPKWIPGGFIGVDIFFVISGYLISSILFQTLNKGYFSFIDFYQRRVRRIFPALMLVLIVCYAAGWLVLLGGDFKSLSKHLAYGTGFLSNFILLGESGYFDATAESKPFLHLWSLGIEEQFYALWPLLVFITFRKKIVFLILTIVIILASFVMGMNALSAQPAAAFYLPQYRAWELLLGALLAYQHTTANHNKLTSPNKLLLNASAVIGLSLIIAGIFLFNNKMPFPGWRALFPTIGTLLLIAAGKDALINRYFCAHPVMVFFGLISYPLYLWHWPLLTFSKLITSSTLSVAVTGLAIFASMLLAFLTYQFIEKPVKKSPKIVTLALIGIACAISAIGFWTYKNDGLSSRFPAAIQYLSDNEHVVKNELAVEKSYRQDVCFMLAADDRPFADECVDANFKNNPRSLLLWGDSHAAMYYPALVDMQKTIPFALAQFTVASCGPLLNARQEYFCPKRTDTIINNIVQLMPDTVILSARWETFRIQDLPETIAFLKHSGVKHIIVMGMAPIWDDPAGLPSILAKKFMHSIPHTVPERALMSNYPALVTLDNDLKNIAESSGATYLSVLNALCDQSGCLTRQGDDLLDLTTLDAAHLTPRGSTYVVQKILLPVVKSNWEVKNTK